MARRWLILAVLGLFVVGCSDSAPKMAAGRADRKEARAPEKKAAANEADGQEVQRKIIFTGRIQLQVEDYTVAMQGLQTLVEEVKGYIARSDEQNSPGSPRYAELVVRVPVGELQGFREKVGKLGEMKENLLDSEDVTEAYHDLREEMLNLEAEEKALRSLMERAEKSANTKPAEIIEVRRELARVRTEINVRKGRLQRWDRLSEYTTFTILLRERTTFTPEDAASLTTRAGRAFSGSLEAMANLGDALVVGVVAVTPWAVLFGLLGLIGYAVWRVFLKKRPILAVEVEKKSE